MVQLVCHAACKKKTKIRAKYYHYPSSEGRESRYLFGRKEVLNRIYFVKKNAELSLLKCYISLFIRMSLSLINFVFRGQIAEFPRILGNITGIITVTR